MVTPRKTRTPPVDVDDDTGAEWRDPIDTSGALIEREREPIEEIELSAADRVAAMLSDVGSDDERAVIKILKQNDKTGRFDFCFDYSPEEFEQGGLTMIRKQWGAGTYRVCLYGYAIGAPGTKHQGVKHYGVRRREQITIIPAAPGADMEAVRQAAPAVDPNTPPPWLALLLERMTPPAPVAAPDPMAQMRGVLELATMMRGAFGLDARAAAPPPRSSITELVEGIRELRDARDLIEGKEPPDDKQQLMGLAKDVIGMVANARNGGQPADPGTMAPVMLPASIEQHQPHYEGEGDELSPNMDTGPVPGQPVQQQPQEGSEVVDFGMFVLRSYIDSLIKLAPQGDASVQQAAQLVAAKMPDEVVTLLDLPDWWDKFSEWQPRVIPHREWFHKVHAAAMPLLFEPDDSAPSKRA